MTALGNKKTMPRTPSKNGPTQRQLQMGEEIRHVLSAILNRGGFDHPALMDGGNITISEVSISPDLKNAKVYTMTLGGAALTETLAALNTFAPKLQHELGKRIRIKFLPRLKFVEDTTFANAEHINTLLHKANIPSE
jgi:ribosome-binding factor A